MDRKHTTDYCPSLNCFHLRRFFRCHDSNHASLRNCEIACKLFDRQGVTLNTQVTRFH